MGSAYRERFRCTLEHKPVDRCPIDLGGTPQSTMDGESSVAALAAYLGLEGDAPSDYGKFDRRILEHYDIDFRRVGDLVSFGTGRERVISDTESVDWLGIRWEFSGLYWEQVGHPLAGASKDEIARYEFPDESGFPEAIIDAACAQAEKLFSQSPYVVVAEHPVFGVLELACWLCGYDDILLMMAADPETVHLLFGKILDFQKMVIKRYYGRLGRWIHLTTSGDDFGTQKSLLMSPAMWREFVMPYFRERIRYTAEFTDAAYMHHTCGAVYDIVPDMLDSGVRIINPIQPAAAGMDPSRLKDDFGERAVFHGGLDTQEVLPSNDRHRIEAAVADLIDAMQPKGTGGFIFAPAHNIQVDVAPASVDCMYRAALDYASC